MRSLELESLNNIANSYELAISNLQIQKRGLYASDMYIRMSVEDKIIFCLLQDNSLQVIKELRDKTGWSLKDSKDAIDNIICKSYNIEDGVYTLLSGVDRSFKVISLHPDYEYESGVFHSYAEAHDLKKNLEAMCDPNNPIDYDIVQW